MENKSEHMGLRTLIRTVFGLSLFVLLILSFSGMVYADTSAEVLELGSIADTPSGEIITLKAHVKNTGDSVFSDCNVNFWVFGGGFNGYVGKTSCNGLEDGESEWYERDWTIPNNALIGEYVYLAIVHESGKYITDWSSPEKFNVIYPQPEKSAKVLRLFKVGDIQAGETASLWAKVKNTGTSATGSDCKVRFWVSWISVKTGSLSILSVRPTSLTIDNYVGDVSCAGLQPDREFAWYRYDWDIPSNAKAGRYTYRAIVDESGEHISSWSVSQEFNILSPTPDKRAEVIRLYNVADRAPGETATLWAKIKNTGTSALSDYSVSFHVSGGGFSGYVGKTSGNSLQPGESKLSSYKWSIPPTAKVGEYTYRAIVDESDEYISSWSDSQSFNVILPTMNKSAKVLGLGAVEDLHPGETAILKAHVENTGSSDLSNCSVSFWVSGGGFNGYAGKTSCNGIKSHHDQWYSYNWVIPSDAKAGGYTYRAIVDESGEYICPWSDSQSFNVVSSRPEKSAEVIRLYNVADTAPGETATLWARIKNTGTSTLTDCKVKFWLTGEGIDNLIGEASCNGLMPDRSGLYKYGWAVPDDAKVGEYNYKVLVEESGAEISLWSDIQSFNVIVTSKQAKVLELGEVSGALKGEITLLSAKVENTGAVRLGPDCMVRFFVKRIDGGKYDCVGEASCNGLLMDNSKWYNYEWNIPSDAVAGEYRYGARVKDDGEYISSFLGYTFTVT
ncbi:MAG: CARDB domain-containing protein [Candidatus Altiarchaeota archaeon]|nr:CARDB domain-containing protein [Candidatus Altiarchaeota archaeon]